MISKILAASLLTASAALAAPTPAPAIKSYWEEQRFTLVAKATEPNPDLPVDGLVVSAVHVGAGQDAAVLLNPSTNAYNTSPAYFYQNGTGAEVADGSGNVLRDIVGGGSDGSPEFPYGLVIGATTPHPVMVNTGSGSPNVGIRGVSYTDPDADGRPFLNVDRFDGRQTSVSVFYACKAHVQTADVPQLEWRDETGATPEGCVEVTLLPQCAGNVTSTFDLEHVQNSPCYPDASVA